MRLFLLGNLGSTNARGTVKSIQSFRCGPMDIGIGDARRVSRSTSIKLRGSENEENFSQNRSHLRVGNIVRPNAKTTWLHIHAGFTDQSSPTSTGLRTDTSSADVLPVGAVALNGQKRKKKLLDDTKRISETGLNGRRLMLTEGDAHVVAKLTLDFFRSTIQTLTAGNIGEQIHTRKLSICGSEQPDIRRTVVSPSCATTAILGVRSTTEFALTLAG